MKSFIVFALLVAVSVAAPAGPEADAQTIINENDNIGVDSFRNLFETTNGIKKSEEGVLTNPGTENEAMEVRGQFSYTGPDGLLYEVVYTAGVDGFKPQGAHIPA